MSRRMPNETVFEDLDELDEVLEEAEQIKNTLRDLRHALKRQQDAGRVIGNDVRLLDILYERASKRVSRLKTLRRELLRYVWSR